MCSSSSWCCGCSSIVWLAKSADMHMWHPMPDTFPTPREPLSSHQGASHLLNITQRLYIAEGTFAAVKACWMILLTVLWRDSLPWLNRQLRPCLRNWSTSLPQYEFEHWCGCPRGAPTLKPTAILMASSLILRPREETGGAISHAPDSTEPAASSLALESTSLHGVRMVSNRMSILRLSPVFYS